MNRGRIPTAIEEDESRFANDMNQFNSSAELIQTTSSK
jgi:hypothetical protein